MKFIDIINLCRSSLSKQKARTRLTILGVTIGCCAIVLMMSLGIGSNEQTKVMLSKMGDLTVINIYNYGSDNKNPLDDKALAKMQAISNVEVATPRLRFSADKEWTIKAGTNYRYALNYVPFMGMKKDSLQKLGYQIKEGEYLTNTGHGVGKKAIPILVGEKFFYEFADTKRPEGKNRRYFKDPKKYSDEYDMYDVNTMDSDKKEEKPFEEPFFKSLDTKLTLVLSDYGMGDNDDGTAAKEIKQELKIVGILKADQARDYATMQGIFMDIDDMKSIIKMANADNKEAKKKKTNYEEVIVKVNEIKNVKDVQNKIKEMGYEATSMESIRESITKNTRQQQIMLAGLGSISLFVAAIGIMNTMIMSITERTKEIGIMKALGCYVNDIRKIFLVEAGVIGFIGGVVGIIISMFVSLLINVAGILGLVTSNSGASDYYDMASEQAQSIWQKLAHIQIDFKAIYQGLITEGSRTSIIPIWLIIFGLIFSTIIGVVSGYHPANKAVKIPALEAIKHE